MSDIKAGDLVMVVRPTTCCGDATYLGFTFTVARVSRVTTTCAHCGRLKDMMMAFLPTGQPGDLSRLKKIDPPADGDSVPIRKDIEVPA